MTTLRYVDGGLSDSLPLDDDTGGGGGDGGWPDGGAAAAALEGLATVAVAPFTGVGIHVAPAVADANADAQPSPPSEGDAARLPTPSPDWRLWAASVADATTTVALDEQRTLPPPPRLRRWLRYDVTVHNARAGFDAAVPASSAVAAARFAGGQRDARAFLRSIGHDGSSSSS